MEVLMKILVGFDGSNTAKEAIAYAKVQARAFNAKIIVVTCVVQSHEVKTKDMDRMADADAALARIQEALEKDGISSETRLLVGDESTGEDLVRFAAEIEADAIVVGIRRRSKIGKLLLGSTAQYVILEAPCPVITVK
jgi:nucleotide-binding universal stress UspA family protein